MAVQIQWRRDTAANWTATDPILAEGEAGLETDTNAFKLGDGVTVWSALPYFSGGGGGGVGLSAGTQSVSTGAVVFSNSNGISFGMSGSSRVTASYTVPSVAGLLSAVNISAGATSNNLSALTFANSNGLTFGLDASTITGSYTVPSVAGLISAINISAGTTSNNLSALTFADSNGVSFGLSGSVITASAAGGMGISAGTQSVSTGTMIFANSNGITFGMSGSSQITASHDGLTTQSGQAFSADASSTFQTLTFQDSNGVSFSNNAGALRVTHDLQFTSATSAITSNALHTSSPRINVSAGTTSNNLSALTFANSNGMSFGINASTVTASYTVPTQSAQTVGVYGSSQTTGQSSSSTVDARSITFRGAGIVSVGMSAGEVIISATGGGGGLTPALSGSNGSFTFSTATLGNLNGASFYTSNGSMVVSYTVPSTAGLLSAINVSAGTISNNLSAMTFGDANGISFGLNGSTITASLDGGAFNAGVSTGGNTAGESGMVSSRMVLVGGNNITLSGDTGALNRITVTIEGQQFAFSANNSSTFKTITFQDSNGISFSNNAGALRITHALAGTTSGFAGANISGSMTINSAGLNMSLSVAPPGAAAENNAINLLGVNTAGNTTATGSTIGLSGIGLVLSGTNDSQVVMSVRGATWQDWDNAKVIQSMNLISNITATAFSRGRPLLFPIELDGHLVWNKAMIDMSRSTSGSNAFTIGFGIYSFVNSSQISLLGSLTNAFSATNTASISGIRRFELSGIGTGASSLTPGHYIGALQFSAAGDATASMNYSLRGGVTANPPVGMIRAGSDSNITATSALVTLPIRAFRGFWSATSANPPGSIGMTEVSMWTTGGHPYLWLGSN